MAVIQRTQAAYGHISIVWSLETLEGLQPFCVLTCSSQPGRGCSGGTSPVLRLMGTLGFACVPLQWFYLHVRASLLQGTPSHPHKVQLWAASKCTVCLAAKSREPGLPCEVGTLPSFQHHSLCCLGILAQRSDHPLQMGWTIILLHTNSVVLEGRWPQLVAKLFQ